MTKARLQYLLYHYRHNTASPSELRELSSYLKRGKNKELFNDLLSEQLQQLHEINPDDFHHYEKIADEVLLNDRQSKKSRVPVKSFTVMTKWAAAASILILVSTLLLNTTDQQSPGAHLSTTNNTVANVIPPGKNGAILTLADGSVIELDSLGNTDIPDQPGATIKAEAGRLAYKSGTVYADTTYNILTTSRGRQYQVLLHDGTRVWLNAASSLKYPIVFPKGTRTVEVTGEAYFEVAKDPSRPFIVKVGSEASVEVLGTSFNVNAYPEEKVVATTVLEGSVKFSAQRIGTERKAKILLPGQQSLLDKRSFGLNSFKGVTTEKVIAWKNGLFDFEEAGLIDVMQQLQRWYDIEVEYQGSIPDIRFFGKMTKNLTLNDLLIILEKSNVHFQIKGKKIIVKT